MKIMYVCLENYPTEGACTNLLLNLFSQKVLRELGEIHVLSLANNSSAPLSEVLDGIYIHRFTSVTRMETKKILFQSKKNFARCISEIGFRIKRHLPSLFPKSNRFYNATMVEETIEALEKIIRNNQIDVVIPVCGYYEAAVASLTVCERHGISMGLYQVDPCTTNQVLPPLTYKSRLAFEKKLYSFSNFVITTPIIHEEMKYLLAPEVQTSVQVMEFPNVVPGCVESKGERTSSMRCLFTGKLYPGARDPGFTIRLFSQITDKNIKLELIGVDQDGLRQYVKTRIPDNIFCCGNMSIEETRNEISAADILVNIGNTATNQVPSKLFEYIASGKPIVNICVTRECPSVPYMEKYPYAINLFQSDESEEGLGPLAEKLQSFIREYSGKTAAADQVADIFRTCTPGYCASLMAKTIQDTVGRN